jgi:putative transposase
MTWQPTKLTRTQLEERRLAGGRLLKRGKLSQAQIARQFNVSREAVRQWAQQLQAGGMPRLYQRISTGRPARLTPAQQRELMRQLKRGALAAGFSTDRWTLNRIQQLIRREFKVTYHPNYLSRLLRQLGWTPQYPLARAKERDDELVEAWLRQDWPRIKKGPSNWRRNRAV